MLYNNTSRHRWWYLVSAGLVAAVVGGWISAVTQFATSVNKSLATALNAVLQNLFSRAVFNAHLSNPIIPNAPFRVWKLAALLTLCLAGTAPALAGEWTVVVQVHDVEALSNSDAWGEQDMYRKIWIEPLVGSGTPAYCDNEDNIDNDNNHVTPGDWGCTMKVTGGTNTLLRIHVEIWDDDDTSGDDELDLNLDHGQLGLEMRFEPRTSKLILINNKPGGGDEESCAAGRIKKSGFGGGGEEPASITFSVSASPASAVDGDTDGDKLLDTWEVCGVNTDSDPAPEVDLKAMGANPFRKDVFVEVDWMATAAHSHEPWLPALIQAWTEFDRAPVTNPTVDGIPNPSGIGLHIDVGTLYANYSLNMDGAGGPELAVDGTGNIDLTLNPSTLAVTAAPAPAGAATIDIGNLGGGNRVPEITPLLRNGGATPSHFGTGSTFEIIKNGAAGVGANFNRDRLGIFHYALFADTLAVGGNVTATTVGLGDSGLSNDDFTVAAGPLLTIPALSAGQTVDSNRDGFPDLGGAPLFGPLGLPVIGTIADHSNIFIHELGHNLGLRHGAFGIDGAPNYLSIMNIGAYRGLAFDNVGNDGIADTTGLDFNGDGIVDTRRFYFSQGVLPALNETSLDETKPVSPTPTPALTRFTCPSVGGAPPIAQLVRADGPVNWDCDATTGETGAAVGNTNINAFGTSAPNEILLGFADYVRIQNGGLELLPDAPSPSLDDVVYMNSHTQRILEPEGREWFLHRCRDPRNITFEEFPEDTKVQAQYGPTVTFLADVHRQPMVVGPAGRNNVATASPDHSLLNAMHESEPAPLVMTFGEPQRVVRLQLGHAAFTHFQRERVRAVLRAFDQRGLAMGIIVHEISQQDVGVDHFLTAVAIYPDERILRVELAFESAVEPLSVEKPIYTGEPMLIDNLQVCGLLDETGLKPYVPPTPKFGDLKVTLNIESEAVHQTGAVTSEGLPVKTHLAFTGLPVTIDGIAATTGVSLTRPEGTTLNIATPAVYSGWTFRYCAHSSGVSFSNGVTNVPLTLLQDGTMTAVYDGRGAESKPGAPATGAEPRDCGCCQCCDKPHSRRSPPCPTTDLRIN